MSIYNKLDHLVIAAKNQHPQAYVKAVLIDRIASTIKVMSACLLAYFSGSMDFLAAILKNL